MKPTIPSNREIAAEFGIQPETPGWKKRCAEKRAESRLQADYQRDLAEYEQTDEAKQDREQARIHKKEKEKRNLQLTEIGCEYLIGAQIIRSKRGTWASVHGTKASPICAAACKVLGKIPGPGNE